jgi:thiamine biosynthesis protein ThiS
MITLNGKPREGAGITLEKLLEENGFQITRVAVGLNGQVVSKDQLPHITLKDGDVVEVFHFMGGG